MKNDKLRREIAEAKGFEFRQESWYDEEGVEGTRLIGLGGEEYTAFGWGDDCDLDDFEVIPDWPDDLNAAWGLVDEMADAGDLFIESWNDDEWFIANHPVGLGRPRELGRCDGRTTGKRDICLAICRAWLKWNKMNGE